MWKTSTIMVRILLLDIIDGNQNGTVVTFESGENSSSLLTGFTIKNGGNIYSGGGVYIFNSSPTLNHLIVENNDAYDGGGINVTQNSTSAISNLIIRNNTSSYGAGLYVTSGSTSYNASPVFTNIEISNNTGSIQGGVHLRGWSNATFINATIYGNTTPADGGTYGDVGGVIVWGTTTATFVNSIINGNSPTNVATGSLGTLNISYSNIEGDWSGTGNIDAAPLFVDATNGNYHLTPSSPCIDAGDPDLDGDGEDYTTDTNDQDPDGTRMDMGAYYYPYSGPTWYISTTGSDSNYGSGNSPFATIQAGIDAASDGDTVIVQAGTYQEANLQVVNKGIYIISATGSDNCIIDATMSGRLISINNTVGGHFKMNGFTMTGGYLVGYRILSVESGIATFENMEFSNNGGISNSNLFGGSGIDQTFFIDCVFKNNVATNYVGVLWSTAIRCLFYDNHGGNNPSPLYESKAINCVVYNTTGGVEENLWTAGAMTNGYAVNCIFWNNNGYQGTQQVYNVYGSAFADSVTYSDIQYGYEGTGNISDNPLFVDAASGVFELLESSPCIDTGDPDLDDDGEDYTTDVDDQDPDGTRMDMGAYYYMQAISVTIISSEASPTNAYPIPITVTFGEDVTGFEQNDVILGNGSISNFSGSGSSYSFDITPSGDGAVTVDIAENVAEDDEGNGNLAAQQFSITYDGTSPTVSISSSATSPTGTSPIPISVEFSEDVSDFTLDDVTITNGSASGLSGSGSSFTLNLTPADDGEVTVDIASTI